MTDILDNNVNTPNTTIRASLAPMAGFTDSVFRRICSEFGAAEVVSEMISAVALTLNDRKTAALGEITQGEAPVVLQIFGHDSEIMARAADILLTGEYTGCRYATPPAGIDINMGCPVKKIVTNGDGSALMKDPALAEKITRSVKKVCESHGVPLSVKFRLGWNAESMNYADFGLAVANGGADKITLHCRTREQMYAPYAVPDHCEVLKNTLIRGGFARVCLVGNGDIETRTDAERYISLGCDEVAIGRSALGNPWIFKELSSPDTFTPPTMKERIALVKDFVTKVVDSRGEVCGIRESRSRAAHFIKGARGSAKIRDSLNRAETLADFLAVLDSIESEM
ncbi:MAG: tRNA dihydrouridine synthase DusB [Ruminococcaceae bacterium]|nr:tRNA dihydrouridine synthase DusB [Oscillospiraceae bacterium]